MVEMGSNPKMNDFKVLSYSSAPLKVFMKASGKKQKDKENEEGSIDMNVLQKSARCG